MKMAFGVRLALTSILGVGGAAMAGDQDVWDGLNTPIGVEFDGNGNIWFTEMGVQGPNNPGNGKINYLSPMLDDTYVKNTFVEGVAVAFNGMGEPTGALQLAFDTDGSLLLATGGPNIPPFPALGSILRYDPMEAVRCAGPYDVLASPALMQQIPVFPFVVGSGYSDSNTYAVAPAGDGDLYIVDSGANALLRWDASADQLSVVVDFPAVENPKGSVPGISQAVPTQVIADGEGGAIVVQLVGFPFADGVASIFQVSAAGDLTTIFTGFQTLIDVEMAADGSLLVTSAGSFDLKIGNFAPGEGKILRVAQDGTVSTVAEGLWCPSGLAIVGEDLWVAQPFAGTLTRFRGLAPQPCPGDLNHDGQVNGADIGLMIGLWGPCF
ncbi:MAG: ScyD/ScyE family protein [Phycisphaerales bacterium]|nr:ScyD/ScyE family protein [Phycisphaerales bacterium]